MNVDLHERELLEIIAKYVKNTHPIVSLKGNPNSIGTSSGGCVGPL
jgi:septum formation topological specificity factor MinE